jgi:hypothetical protein
VDIRTDPLQKTVSGDSDPKHVSTSFVERPNLSMRMRLSRNCALVPETARIAKQIDKKLLLKALAG